MRWRSIGPDHLASDRRPGRAAGILRHDLDAAAAAARRVQLPPAARPPLQLLLLDDQLLHVVAVLAGRRQQQRALHLRAICKQWFHSLSLLS